MLNLGITGASGRMGQEIIKTASLDPRVKIAKLFDINNKASEILSLENKSLLTNDINEFIKDTDAFIDFSAPEFSLGLAKKIADNYPNKLLVIGTTGFDDKQMEILNDLAKKTRILWSSNMSIAVNLLFKLAENMASILKEEDYDAEILEIHHNKKVDSPSGTAITLGEMVAKGRKQNFKEVASLDKKSGIIGARKVGEIGFSAIRGGAVIGDHSVIFSGQNDVIEISHRSMSRSIYARGAIDALNWLAKKEASKLYHILDILNN